jgi:hypothetical protein
LLFLQKKHNGKKISFTADPRSAREVGDVLVKNGVKYAILNACRSAAAAGSADSNIATTLLNRGLLTVVAMSYKIASSAVYQMVRAVYKGLLLDGLTLPAALRDARAAMLRHPAKQTRYGVAVDVLDYLVPRCFQRLGVESQAVVKRAAPSVSSVELSIANQAEDVVGRETDILLLESALLMQSNVGILWGEPGIGKTALMRSVSEWWSKTFLIQNRGLICLNLSLELENDGEEPVGADMAQLKAGLAELLLGSADRASDVVQYLNENRHLVVIDHLDTWKFPDGRTQRQQQKLLKRFLSEVFSGASLFVLVSRHLEGWLDNLAPLTQAEKPTFSLRMTGLAPSRAIRLFSAQVAHHGGPKLVSLEHDTSKYLEGLVKLVNGNPLAVKMLAYDFCQKTVSIKEYLPGLLEGATIDLQPNLAELDHESRVIRQLRRYCDKCTQEVLDAALSIRLARIFARHSNTPGEHDPDLTEVKARLHPTTLGMFWGAMPMENIVSYVMFAALGVMGNQSHFQMIRGLFGINRPPPSPVQMEVTTLMFFNLLSEPDGLNRASALAGDGKMAERMTSQFNTLIDDLRELDLIDSPAAIRTENDPQAPYHWLSPVLTLYLRGDSNFKGGRGALQEAFACFQLQSCLSFPFQAFYWRDDWDQTRKQIGLNFYNYYGALLSALHRPPGNVLGEWSILMIISHLSKGVFADKTRYELLAVAFEKTLERGIRLLAEPPVVDPLVAALLCGQAEPIAGVGSPQELVNFGLLCAVLLEVILSATVFRTGQFDGSRSRDDDLKPLLQPHADAVLARLNGIDHDHARRAAKSIEYAWQGLTADVDNPEPFWSMRERYLSWVAESNGDSVPASQDRYRGRNIPHWLNSLTVSGATLLDVQGEVSGLRKRRRFDEARRVVRRALEEELMTGSNQLAIRIGLLECLVDIDTDDEKWEDAIANINVIHKLQDSLPSRQTLSLERRIEREQQLALLYDRAGDAATAQHLVKSLLRRANALHATDRRLEAKTLLLLSKLPIVRRLDADVSAIYLLARALLVLERSDPQSNDPTPTVDEGLHLKIRIFIKTMGLTNDTQTQWMLGPANSRPQSVAIFFLSTIFGQIVFPTFGIRLLLDSSPSVQRIAQSLGLSSPLSLQQYAAINMLVTLRSMFSPQADSDMWAFLSGNGGADGPMEADVIEVAQDFCERLFQRPGWQPRFSKFDGLDVGRQCLFFDHFYNVGEQWLAGTVRTHGDGALELPETPWTPATVWGTTGPQGVFPGIMAVPEGYTVSSEMILRLAGYMVNEWEEDD